MRYCELTLLVALPKNYVTKIATMMLIMSCGCANVWSQNAADLRIRDICRVKGQEKNTLQGLGVVVGLTGTGDGDSPPTARALARTLQLMGGQIGINQQGALQTSDVEDAANVALVVVTATIPETGVQQGDQLDCKVAAISAGSLEGGTLLLTPMLGPRADQQTVYALAQGQLNLEDAQVPTSAKIENGVKCEANIVNEFISNNYITLVLNPNHSSFTTSQYIEDRINELQNNGFTDDFRSSSQQSISVQPPIATALDQVHVKVRVPNSYFSRPVAFVSDILNITLPNLRENKRIVIQEREGVVIIGDDVTIEPVAISHKNLTINAGNGITGRFVGVDTESANDGEFGPGQNRQSREKRPRLQNLVDSLRVLDVPTQDIIAIIKALKRQGNLYGELVIE